MISVKCHFGTALCSKERMIINNLKTTSNFKEKDLRLDVYFRALLICARTTSISSFHCYIKRYDRVPIEYV